MFEAKIAEMMNPSEAPNSSNIAPRQPRQLLRLGVTTRQSATIEECAETVFFDSEGSFYDGSRRRSCARRFGKDQVMSVLINLDAQSPNANTVSLFCDGKRFSD